MLMSLDPTPHATTHLHTSVLKRLSTQTRFSFRFVCLHYAFFSTFSRLVSSSLPFETILPNLPWLILRLCCLSSLRLTDLPRMRSASAEPAIGMSPAIDTHTGFLCSSCAFAKMMSSWTSDDDSCIRAYVFERVFLRFGEEEIHDWEDDCSVQSGEEGVGAKANIRKHWTGGHDDWSLSTTS